MARTPKISAASTDPEIKPGMILPTVDVSPVDASTDAVTPVKGRRGPRGVKAKNDAGAGASANASSLPVRSSRGRKSNSSPHADGYAQPSPANPDMSGAPAEDGASTDDREARIRRRAHTMWEQEGFPEGEHERHWHAAREEIDRKK